MNVVNNISEAAEILEGVEQILMDSETISNATIWPLIAAIRAVKNWLDENSN
jgi:hypothetical protein